MVPGAAYASCPAPEHALTSTVAERFRTYLGRYFPEVGDRSRALEDRLVLVGYALGRQAPAAGEDPARRDAFDCLLVALDQRAYLARLLEERELNPVETQRAFRTLYAAAMGMHDDRVAALTGYDVDTVLPTVFDPPSAWGPAGRAEASGADDPDGGAPLAIDPDTVGAYRDGAVETGLGPDHGPGGARWPLERSADVVFHVFGPFGGTLLCWSLDGALWCGANYRWTDVAVSDGDSWAMAPLNGEPPCTYETEWRRIWDAGEPAFGGTAWCPDREEPLGWRALDYRKEARTE
jgi:hypothetical protein